MMTTMGVMALGGLGILSVAWTATVSFRRSSASLRHSIWLAGLCAAAALPAFEAMDVEIALPVPEAVLIDVPGLAVADDAVVGEDAPAAVDALARQDVEAGQDVGVGESAADGGASAAGAAVGATGEGERAGSAAAERLAAPVAEDARLAVGNADTDGVAAATNAGSAGHVGSGSATSGLTAYAAAALSALPVVLWAAVAGLLLFGTLLSQLAARAVTVRQTRPASDETGRRLRDGMRRLGVRRAVRLVVSPRVAVPATWGVFRPTIVLPEEYEAWSPATLDRVLLHELAHIRRADCAAYLVGEVARALHWFNPLAWIAVRRLRAESERASDDRVLDVAEAPSDYADDLVTMARAMRDRSAPPRALAAMARESGVSDRVRAILDPTRSRRRVRPSVATTIVAVALALVVSMTMVTPVATAQDTDAHEPPARVALTDDGVAPDGDATLDERAPPVDGGAPVEGAALRGEALLAPQERLCVFRPGGNRSVSTSIDEDEVRIRWETDDCRVEVDMEGDVEFSDDDRRIVALGADALFEIEERLGRDRRRARIEGRSGGVERRYWVDGDEVAWGAEADRWLAALLPQIFRHSTINAEARVRRMVEEGGPDRVFDEVARIHSDHVSRRYLELLMDAAELSEADYRRVIDAAGSIDSDHGSAELLLAVVERAGMRPAFQDPLLAASEGLDSDHQRTRVLQALLDSELSDRQLDAVLRSARSVDSDHNLGELLSSIAREGRLGDAGRASFLATLRSVESDHQQARVIHAFLDSGRLSDAELASVLEMMDDIDSDHQRADVLQRVAREYPLTGPQVTMYLRSVSRMDSDHQKASTASVIIERSDFDGEQLDLVLRLTEDVDSDHQRAEILGRIVERHDLTPSQLSELVRVAGRMDSDHQLATVLGRVLDEQDLRPGQLVDFLGAVARIDSSHQRATVLLSVARAYDLEGEARSLYVSLADDLSRHDRERVLAEIAR